MSAYTTLNITRGKAKQMLMETLMGDITDEQLEEFMDSVLDDRLYNANIVPDHCENDDSIV